MCIIVEELVGCGVSSSSLHKPYYLIYIFMNALKYSLLKSLYSTYLITC